NDVTASRELTLRRPLLREDRRPSDAGFHRERPPWRRAPLRILSPATTRGSRLIPPTYQHGPRTRLGNRTILDLNPRPGVAAHFQRASAVQAVGRAADADCHGFALGDRHSHRSGGNPHPNRPPAPTHREGHAEPFQWQLKIEGDRVAIQGRPAKPSTFSGSLPRAGADSPAANIANATPSAAAGPRLMTCLRSLCTEACFDRCHNRYRPP